MFNTILGGFNQGLPWAVLAIGVFVSFRLLDFADLTCEGSFAWGGAVAAVLIQQYGWNGIPACLIALIAGGVAGLITALLHTKLKIAPILSGIITLTAMYSITLITMNNKASIGLLNVPLFYSWIPGMKSIYAILIMGVIIIAIIIAVVYWFFGTELGSAIRSTGVNERMSRAQGINTDNTKIIGLVISNALIALSGALVAQEQGTASWTMGQGAIVAGLASVIIGETIIPSNRNFALTLVGVTIGSIIYRIIYSLVYYFGLPTEYIKLSTAVLVVIALCLPMIKTKCIALAKKLDAKWRAKYPKYAAYAQKRDDKKAQKAEKAKSALADKITNLSTLIKSESDVKKAKTLQRQISKAKEKFAEKYGSKELEDVEEHTEAASVAVIGGNDNVDVKNN